MWSGGGLSGRELRIRDMLSFPWFVRRIFQASERPTDS